MDTNKEYIEMCKQASEIQEIWEQPKWHDFVVDDKGYTVNIMLDSRDHKELVWLPRQDQLQEMLKTSDSWINELGSYKYKLECFCDWFNSFCDTTHHFVGKSQICNSMHYVSMEQLWLAFVMKEKFNKTWNGTEWVKEPDLRDSGLSDDACGTDRITR